MTDQASEVDRLFRRATHGDPERFGTLLEECRPRLRRMVAQRLDPRLHGRIDPSDVIQETYLEASGRLAEYLRKPALPFPVWLQFLAGQKLVTLHRHHLGCQMRAAGREVSLRPAGPAESPSAAPAGQVPGREERPSEAVARAERRDRLREALDALDLPDREILALRHFEQLSLAEAAAALGITESGACRRHMRALARLKDVLGEGSQLREGLLP
jgi:RNA polymerase sigma-70 factor, ECF subfamily